jgi:ferrous iron transport protein B
LEGGNLPALKEKINPQFLKSWKEEFEVSVGMKAQVFFYQYFRKESEEILKDNFKMPNKRLSFREELSLAMINPIYGIPILLLILYFGIYQFVGVFGAGTVVGYIEENIFGLHINPVVTTFFEKFISADWLRKLFVGDYGLFTLGITYAFALVLPVVFFFFLIFSTIEDSGYFPRLALLIDKIFKIIGLNGRAVIPMVLGLGCDTMATITTRTLESKKERILATFLLSLAIPCSAQLGLITGLLSDFGFFYWLGYIAVITSMFFCFGWLGKKIIKGDSSSFFMEMPPLRIPLLSNVFLKSFSRMKWYFIEVIPLFLIASVILWGLDLSGGMDILHGGIKPLMNFIGLPESAAESFLIGFFRRDFGAAGLFKLVQEGSNSITPIQVFVGSVTLTLFVPCVAQFMIMCKERGIKAAIIIFMVVTSIAFCVGGFLNYVIHFAKDFFV